MAKKGNTLNDLTKFLAAEQKVVLEQPDINHESFLEKQPVSLIDIHQDIPISILEIKSVLNPQFIYKISNLKIEFISIDKNSITVNAYGSLYAKENKK